MTRNTSDFVPVCVPVLSPEDEAAVLSSIKTGWISSAGPAIGMFEEEWSRYCGMKHGVAVSSGTAALQVAVDCLDLRPGDEVILPSLTIISCVLAILRAGATPVVVECTPGNYLIDPDAVAAAVTNRTRAIMVVHLFGHPVDMAPIWQLADERGLHIIEDASQAHGAQYHEASGPQTRWRRCGGLGTIATFSFYANKTITTGEGGMLLTDDATLAARARSLRNLGFGTEERFRHDCLGYNFRMTNAQAALGLSQASRIDNILQTKQAIQGNYDTLFRGFPLVELQRREPWARCGCWMYPIVIAEPVTLSAAELARRLAVRGVETRPFFLGLHEQPALRSRGLFAGVKLPVTESLYRRGLYIPSGLGLSRAQQEQVAVAVMEELRLAD